MASATFGYGKWPRPQLYAIVATYWRMGRSDVWVARKLGVSLGMVQAIYGDVSVRAGWIEGRTDGEAAPTASRRTNARKRGR